MGGARMFVLGCAVTFVVMLAVTKNPFMGNLSARAAKALHHRYHLRGVPHSHDAFDEEAVKSVHIEHAEGRVTGADSSIPEVPELARNPPKKAAVTNEDFTPKFPEHIKSIRESTWHHEHKDVWEEQGLSRPFREKEREIPCGVAAATERNLHGVQLVRAALDGVQQHYPIDWTKAKQAFREATDLDPHCTAPYLNRLIVTLSEAVTEDDSSDGQPSNSEQPTPKEAAITDAIAKEFDTFPQEKWTAKMHFWRGILEEFRTSTYHSAHYARAIQLDPKLKREYMHPIYIGPTMLMDSKRKPYAPLLRRALIQLLMYYEFAPSLGAFGKITYEDALRFKRDWHLKVPNFLPQYCFHIISRYYGAMVLRKLGQEPTGYKGSGTYEANSDCLNQWYNVRVEEFVAKLAGTPVVATYGYTAGYVNKDILKWHTDRKSCEFTLTTLVHALPSPVMCPLYIEKTPRVIDENWIGRYEDGFVKQSDVINVQPQVNELVIIRGRAVPHYRPPLPQEAQCTTFMLHYVPLSEYKSDFHEKFHEVCDTPAQCPERK